MRYFVADFETTNVSEYKKEEFTNVRVWGAGLCEVGDDKVALFGNLKSFLDRLATLEGKIIVYFHNLRFDGSFILDYLMKRGWKLGEGRKLKDYQLSTLISNMGVWYTMKIRYKKKVIEFRDSMKLLPFSVDAIAKNFGTKAQKLVGSIDYNKERKFTGIGDNAEYFMTDEEKLYLKNDILVMSEALEMIKQYKLLDHITIGGACMADFKERIGKTFDKLFPELDTKEDANIRKAYRGGWVYAKNPGESVYELGHTYDVNSLYPWAMYKHAIPMGKPIRFTEEDLLTKQDFLYVIKFTCDFKIKPKHLPFLQIKNSRWRSAEFPLEAKDVELTLTKIDFELMLDQYDIDNFNFIDGWCFNKTVGVFDDYIEHWHEVKKNAKNKVERQIAKLMLNNLYGKLGTNPIAGSNLPGLVADNEPLKFFPLVEERKSVYIPAACFITAYAREKTIRSAQANYDKFCYADTDSIHMIGEADNLDIGKELGQWKVEGTWDKAKFVRAKTYIEHIIEEDLQPVEKPYWDIKACGAPDTVKERLLYEVKIDEDLTKDEKSDIINNRRSDEEFMTRFSVGLIESGKLLQKRVNGGVILINTTFQILDN